MKLFIKNWQSESASKRADWWPWSAPAWPYTPSSPSYSTAPASTPRPFPLEHVFSRWSAPASAGCSQCSSGIRRPCEPPLLSASRTLTDAFSAFSSFVSRLLPVHDLPLIESLSSFSETGTPEVLRFAPRKSFFFQIFTCCKCAPRIPGFLKNFKFLVYWNFKKFTKGQRFQNFRKILQENASALHR